MLASRTSSVQFAVFVAFATINIVGLVWLNGVKAAGYVPQISWAKKRTIYWICMLITIAFSCWLDLNYDIHELFVPVKVTSLESYILR